MKERGVLHRPVEVARLPAEAVEIVADAVEREALAAEYGLVAIDRLMATATLTPGARGAVEVEGRVLADIVQTCVVSLVPVAQHIDETFALKFVQPADAPPEPQPGTEVAIDPDRPDPPEVLTGPHIDLGAVVEEVFVLAIDPYPRAPDAALPPEAAAATEKGGESPFAVLAGLRRPKDEGG